MSNSIKFIIEMNSQQNYSKYKTMLCKHYETTKNCSHRDKCQFAHGVGELRTAQNVTFTFTF